MAKRARGRRADDTMSYVVEFKGWDWSFSFGINRSKHFPGPYQDFRHLCISGTLLRPNNLKVNSVDVTLLPDVRLNLGVHSNDKLTGVGSLQVLNGKLQALLSMPADALLPVLQVLTAGRLRYAVLEGEPLRYRQGLLHSYRLDMSIDEEDLAAI